MVSSRIEERRLYGILSSWGREWGLRALGIVALAAISWQFQACSSGETTGDAENGDNPPAADATASGTDALPPGDGASSAAAVGNDPLQAGATTGAGKPSVAVELKKEPFESGGVKLNAYYFVRSPTETWVSVSEKVLGSPDQADKLKELNAGASKLRAGSVVYYASVKRPGDAKMLSFYEENGGAAEPYQVKKGDTLSLIAKTRYGAIGAWKEIMALNPQLKTPDQVPVGMTIQLPTGASAGNDSMAMNSQAASGESAIAPPPAASQPIAQAQPVVQQRSNAAAQSQSNSQTNSMANTQNNQVSPATVGSLESNSGGQAQAPVTSQGRRKIASESGEGDSSEPGLAGKIAMLRALKDKALENPITLPVGGGVLVSILVLALVMARKARMNRA